MSQLHETLSAEQRTALGLEWLEADGLGGYACGTALGLATRRYHGLLVSRLPGESARHLLLSRFAEELGGEWDGQAPAVHNFAATPYPTTECSLGDVSWRRETLVVRGARISMTRWTLLHHPDDRQGDSAREVELRLRPFTPFRGADDLTVWNAVLVDDVEPIEGGVRVQPYAGLPQLALTWSGAPAAFEAESTWERGLSFTCDEARGYTGGEDQWSPGVLRVRLAPGDSVVVAATPDEPVRSPEALWEVESEVRREEHSSEEAGTPAQRAALNAADFLYRDDQDRPGILAGFPWFGEWGRDTFIALPGLTLARGEVKACADVLAGAQPFLVKGLLPNVFGADPETSHYGSVDASLWYARAVRLWSKANSDRTQLLDVFRPALTEIAEGYMAGTELGVSVDADGGLVAGNEELNATWMDANTPDGPVTPRAGCAVELNALWYQLLETLEDLALLAGDRVGKKRWTTERRQTKRTFLKRFWIEEGAYLADVWRDGVQDVKVRPNMVLAAALDSSPLTRVQRAGVVERARLDLLTPHGLRTLAPADPAYVGRYEGGPLERDAAYHQGTVWPWLLGFYVEACLRANGSKRTYRDELRQLWATLEADLDVAGLGHISEVYDGDEPRRPAGTFAQAWNTAEYLRSLKLLSSSRL